MEYFADVATYKSGKGMNCNPLNCSIAIKLTKAKKEGCAIDENKLRTHSGSVFQEYVNCYE